MITFHSFQNNKAIESDKLTESIISVESSGRHLDIEPIDDKMEIYEKSEKPSNDSIKNREAESSIDSIINKPF